MTTLPDVLDPDRLPANACRKLPSVALLLVSPSAVIRLLKLCCSEVSAVLLLVLLLDVSLDDVLLEEDSCAIRLFRSVDRLP